MSRAIILKIVAGVSRALSRKAVTDTKKIYYRIDILKVKIDFIKVYFFNNFTATFFDSTAIFPKNVTSNTENVTGKKHWVLLYLC